MLEIDLRDYCPALKSLQGLPQLERRDLYTIHLEPRQKTYTPKECFTGGKTPLLSIGSPLIDNQFQVGVHCGGCPFCPRGFDENVVLKDK